MPTARRFAFIDPVVQHISVSQIRLFNRKELKALDHPVLVHARDRQEPVAVLLSYTTYMQMQKIIMNGLGPMLDKLIGEGE